MTDEPIWAKGREKPPAWRSDAGQTRFANRWIEIVDHRAIAPTGHETPYAVVRFRNRAIGVLPLHEDGTVTLVGQQRFALGNYSWEMPEGGAPFDEDPLDGARRELREEVGLIAGDWRKILDMELSNSVTDEVAVCYLARDLSPCEIDPDETEQLDSVRVPFRELLSEILNGAVRDSLTVATCLRVYHMAREGELPNDLARAMLDPAV
jgi:8-oxo-dGTP pyrophosphatase MutT (NUDIX family)